MDLGYITGVSSIMLQLVANQKAQKYEAGATIIEQGVQSGPLLVLVEGEVEILRDDVRVAKCSIPGAVFGEMSVLLETPTTATVRALSPCILAVIDDPQKFLAATPAACLEIARLLAARVDALNKYLVDVKRQYEGHDHLGMVDDVLETLMQRQPRSGRR